MNIDVAVGLIGVSALLAQGAFVVLLFLLILSRLDKKNLLLKSVVKNLGENAFLLSFFVALFATVGSLFLSEIGRLPPCKLCWYQRIFIFPQVFLLGIAAVRNDFGIKKYILTLSVVGLAIAVYHYLLQMSPLPLPCSDEIANCAAKQLVYFGYITIPFMSLVAFALIILLMLFVRKK